MILRANSLAGRELGKTSDSSRLRARCWSLRLQMMESFVATLEQIAAVFAKAPPAQG